MKKLLNNRQNQISALLIVVAAVTICNFIIPAYEHLSYYQGKNAALEKQYQQLYGYSLHVKHHEDLLPKVQKELAEIQQLYSGFRDSSFLQNRLGAIQRDCQLKIVQQEIRRGTPSRELESMQIQQTLDGKYDNQLRYLKTVLNDDSSLILEQYRLENQEPFVANPTLTAQLRLTLFLPKK